MSIRKPMVLVLAGPNGSGKSTITQYFEKVGEYTNAMDKKSSEYKLIRMADTGFLFCIIFEVAGIMTVMFLGTLGAQMAKYFMTMLFAVFMARKRRAEFTIPFEKPKVGTLLQSIGISVCGIPIALMI